MKGAWVVAAAALLVGCGQQDNPGGLTAEENEELNEAAAMLDSAETLPGEAELANAEGEALPATAPEAANAQ